MAPQTTIPTQTAEMPFEDFCRRTFDPKKQFSKPEVLKGCWGFSVPTQMSIFARSISTVLKRKRS